MSWNVNGIRAALRKGFGQWYAHQRPDILALQETRVFPRQLTTEQLSADNVVWNPASRAGYSGTAVLSSVPPHKTRSRLNHTQFANVLAREGRFMELSYGGETECYEDGERLSRQKA